MTKDYVVVTTVSSFRHRYVMHKDDLRKLNLDIEPNDHELSNWAGDTVTCEECTEEEMLTLFDRDNDYLSGWERDQKIKWVRDTITRTKIGTHE